MFNVYHLKYFFDSVRLGSLAEAAEQNHSSRPGVSQAIKSLERQLGVSLVRHKKNGFKLTKEGEWLYRQSSTILSQVNAISSKIKGVEDKPQGPLRVGYSRSLARLLLPKSVQDLETKYPEMDLRIKLGTSKELLSALDKSQIDAALIVGDLVGSIESKTISEGYFVCVSSKYNRFQNRYLITEERPETIALKSKLSASKKNVSFLEIGSWDLILEMSVRGLGIGLVPDFLAKLSKTKSVRVLPEFKNIAPYSIFLIFKTKNANTTALAASFKYFN